MADQQQREEDEQWETVTQQVKYHAKAKVHSIEELKEDEKTKLHRSYTIWVLMKQNMPQNQEQSYESVLKPVASFSTVKLSFSEAIQIEDFWANYSHMKRPTQMTFGTFLHIFAEGIKPLWEHDQCKDGGRWTLRVPKTHTNKYWEDLLLAMIGEQFTNEGEINGIAISLKPSFDIISIWNKSGKDQAKIQAIKEDIERFVSVDSESMKLEYENFAEVLSRPKPEKKEFTRNFGGNQEESTGANSGFDRNQFSRGGGRGRGRGGRGQQ